MSHHPTEPERFLDQLFEAELHVDSLAMADEFLEARAARCQKQALASLGQLPAVERERLTILLGVPEGKQGISTRFAEELFLQANALSHYREESCSTLDGELRELAAQARDALRNASRHKGRERADDLKDAESLLQSALKNPLAARNAALWFDLGWVLWKRSDENLSSAEEAFYQAVRLSANGSERFHRHALRHLAHLQASQKRGEEAFSTIQRILDADGNDPQLWLEAARYATLAGRLAEAGKLAGRALECDPGSISALFAEPDLAELGSARVQALEQITENARGEFARRLQRWRENGRKVVVLEELLRHGIPLAPELAIVPDVDPTGLSLFAAQRMTQRASEQADAVRAEGLAHLDEALRGVKEQQEQVRRRIDLVTSEKKRWEHEIRVIEEQAEASKIPLHPYNWENPLFRARNARAKHLRDIYASCKANLTYAEQAVTEQLPALEKERAAITDRVIELEAARRAVDVSS